MTELWEATLWRVATWRWRHRTQQGRWVERRVSCHQTHTDSRPLRHPHDLQHQHTSLLATKKSRTPEAFFQDFPGGVGTCTQLLPVLPLPAEYVVRGLWNSTLSLSPSIHPSVWHILLVQQCVAGLLLWAGRVRDIDRLVHGWRFSRTAHSSKRQQCQVSSICRQLNGLFVACPLGPSYWSCSRTTGLEAELLVLRPNYCQLMTDIVSLWQNETNTFSVGDEKLTLTTAASALSAAFQCSQCRESVVCLKSANCSKSLIFFVFFL